MLYIADCSEQVGTEQQGKIGILPGLPSMSEVLELQTWEEKNPFRICVCWKEAAKQSCNC